MEEEADLDVLDAGRDDLVLLHAVEDLGNFSGGGRANGGGALVEGAQKHGEEHEVVVLHPDHTARLELLHDRLRKRKVGLPIREPILLVEIHLAGVVVEEGPQDGVGEAVVVAVGDVVVEVDGLAGVLVAEAGVDERAVFGGDEEAGPADPGEGHALFAAGEGGDEAAGGHLEVVLARGVLGDGDGEAVGDDDEVGGRAVEVEGDGVAAGGRHGEEGVRGVRARGGGGGGGRR